MKIMVCYDDANVTRAALDLAKQQAKAFDDSSVHLVEVLEQSPELTFEAIQKVERKLDELARDFKKKENIPCDTHALVSQMSPGEALVQYAQDKGIDMAVMGVRRRSKVGKLLFGSTAQYVILNAPCPVLTVK